MITLSKENVVDYVKSRLDFFNLDGDIKVSAIGEGTVEEDGDGFINFVYRVSDGKHHLIVKQSTLEARSKGSFTLDLNRYKLEYDAMKICAAIVPDLIPKLYDCDEEIKYDKTQAVEYIGNFIDTPGEYMQQRGYWGSLTITSHDADIIGLVQDSSSEDCWFSGGLTSKFEKPVVGVITKIDKDDSNPKQARSYLELAGCTTIFEVSSYTGEGVEALSQGFHDMVYKYREENKGRYADDYFD